MTILNKVCIKHECGWRTHCYLYEANNHLAQIQFFSPPEKEEFCHYYAKKCADWTQGSYDETTT